MAEQDTSILICLGPGGVGKTTTAASLALAAATSGRRAVVLTVDPARRIAEAMGLAGDIGNEPVKVSGPWQEGGGALWAAMLDSSLALTELIEDLSSSPQQAAQISANPIFQNLTHSLSGTHEYMAGERLRQLALDERFDVVVVDTPPAHHAIDFLDSPGRLTRFFDHRLYRTVLAPRPGIMKALSSAAQIALRTLAKVVGANLLQDVTELFKLLEGVDLAFRDRADEVNNLLRSARAEYVLVSGPRPEPLRTASWMANELSTRQRTVGLIVANRMTPEFGNDPDVQGPLAENLRQLTELAESERALVRELIAGASDDADLVILEELPEPAVGLEDLSVLAQQFSSLWKK